MSDFARKLKFLRDRDQVTLNRLATAIGMAKDYLRDVEAGRTEPTAQVVWLVSEFFKVKPDYFGPIGGKEKEREREKEAGPADRALAPRARAAERAGADPHSRGASGKGDFDFVDFAYFREGGAPSAGGPREARAGEDFDRRVPQVHVASPGGGPGVAAQDWVPSESARTADATSGREPSPGRPIEAAPPPGKPSKPTLGARRPAPAAGLSPEGGRVLSPAEPVGRAPRSRAPAECDAPESADPARGSRKFEIQRDSRRVSAEPFAEEKADLLALALTEVLLSRGIITLTELEAALRRARESS